MKTFEIKIYYRYNIFDVKSCVGACGHSYFFKGGCFVETIEQIKLIINDYLKQKEYSLYSFRLVNGKNKTLEIVIDREEPINLDDITVISNELSKLLESHEFCEDSYILDISSLGAEKPIKLENLDKYLGKYVNIHTTHPFKGLSYVEGTIESIDDENVCVVFFIKGKKTKAVLERKYLDKARLAIKF